MMTIIRCERVVLWTIVILYCAAKTSAAKIPPSTSPSTSSQRTFRRRFGLPGGRPYEIDSDDDYENSNSKEGLLLGTGREWNLFETSTTSTTSTRGGQQQPQGGSSNFSPDDHDVRSSSSSSSNFNSYPYRQGGRAGGSFPSSSSSSSRRYYSSAYNTRRRQQDQSSFFQPITDWWSNNVARSVKNWPKLSCKVEPTTTLKIRKTFRPLKTIVRLGADFNTQLGVWQFRSSWEDAIVGGKLMLFGRELQFSKSWQFSVGAMSQDLVTRLRLRAAVDLQTWKAYCRVGFRTERLSPINVMEGFTIMKQLPLDGNKGHVKLEVKANLALPEPEIEYSTETQRSLIGMGDIEVNIEELNLVLDY